MNLSRGALYNIYYYLTYNEHDDDDDDDDDDHEGSFAVIYRKTQRQDYPELFNLFSTPLEVLYSSLLWLTKLAVLSHTCIAQ